MKIYILAQGRSGSNTITKAIADALKLRVVFKPSFDQNVIDHTSFHDAIQEDNIVIKLHQFQKTDNFDTQTEFLRYIHDNFDHVIYHCRANSFDAGLSFQNGMENGQNWTIKYTPTVSRPEINHIRFAAQQVSRIILYAKTFDHDVTFYEELFTGDKQRTIDTIKRWNIEFNSLSLNMLLERFNPKHKYTNNG